MMKKTYKILPTNEIKIIKKIELITSNSNEKDIVAGFIIYKRDLSNNYKFTEQTKEVNDFKYLLRYPKEEEYPMDEVDQLILKTIQTEFPDARVRNELLFSSSDVEYYDKLIKRPSEEAELIIEPCLSEMEIQDLSNKILSSYWNNINIYVNHSSELIKNITFRGYCDFTNREEIYDQIEYSVKFL